MATANEVIKIAKAEVGYLEKKSNSKLDSKTANAGSNNYTKYANDFDKKYTDFYNGKKNGFAWCDIFVDWCFVTAFGVSKALELLGQPKKSCGAGCEFSANYYKKKKRFYKTAKVGDQIFFKDSKGVPCHTGLVYKVDSNYVYTIEGNTSSKAGVVANGGCVAKKKYKKSYGSIYGYGRPNYNTEAKTTAAGNTEPKSKTKTYTVIAQKGLYLRTAAVIDNRNIICIMPYNSKVTYRGVSKTVNGVKWLKVTTAAGKTGYCSSEFLK